MENTLRLLNTRNDKMRETQIKVSELKYAHGRVFIEIFVLFQS